MSVNQITLDLFSNTHVKRQERAQTRTSRRLVETTNRSASRLIVWATTVTSPHAWLMKSQSHGCFIFLLPVLLLLDQVRPSLALHIVLPSQFAITHCCCCMLCFAVGFLILAILRPQHRPFANIQDEEEGRGRHPGRQHGWRRSNKGGGTGDGGTWCS